MGGEIFRHQRCRACRRPAARRSRRLGRRHGRHRGGQARGPQVAAADPLPGHPPPSRRARSTRRSARRSPSTATRAATAACFPSRSTSCAKSSRKSSTPGRPFDFGLEAGSKRELIAGARDEPDPDSLIICNGYKDCVFIRMALLGLKLGKQGHHRRRKARGAPPDHQGLARSWASSPSSACASGCRARAPANGPTSGGENAKFGLTHRRDPRPPPRCSRPRASADCLQARPLPHRLAGPRHPDGQGRGARRRALLREAAQDGLSASNISTSAAASAWTTTARALGLRQLHQLLAAAST